MFFSRSFLFSFFSLLLIFHSSAFSTEAELQPETEEILNSESFVKLINPRYISPKGDEEIKKSNQLFIQYQKDIELNNKLKRIPPERRKSSDYPSAYFYTYTVKEDQENYLNTFNGLSARLQISQGTLATVNKISKPELSRNQTLILPVNQGLFINKNPQTALEVLIKNEYSGLINENTARINIDGTSFYFLPDKNFSSTDISFFHDDSMQLPLNKKILTSAFGYRTSPISGKWTFHAGIDLAAPEGTEVYACKSGIVTKVSYNSTYGNYIILLHNGTKTSLYAHLSKTLVRENDRIASGQAIGLVGTTGASTGPHLHFEVRENGNPKDPGKLIK